MFNLKYNFINQQISKTILHNFYKNNKNKDYQLILVLLYRLIYIHTNILKVNLYWNGMINCMVFQYLYFHRDKLLSNSLPKMAKTLDSWVLLKCLSLNHQILIINLNLEISLIQYIHFMKYFIDSIKYYNLILYILLIKMTLLVNIPHFLWRVI